MDELSSEDFIGRDRRSNLDGAKGLFVAALQTKTI